LTLLVRVDYILHLAQLALCAKVARPARRGGLSHREPPEKDWRGVGFLARIIRFLFWFVILSWAVWLVRRLFRAGAAPSAHPPAPRGAVRLYRDPMCGTHVSPEISFPLEDAGQVLHFCSAECRERYRTSERRAASR